MPPPVPPLIWAFSVLWPKTPVQRGRLSHNGQIIEAEKVHGAFMAALSFPYAKVISSTECLKQIDVKF
jgi:hypothetical protein